MIKKLKQTTAVLATQAVMFGILPVAVQAATFKLVEATVGDINAAFDAGALTSEQLTQLYLNRIEAYDNNGPNINSLITINPNALQTAAALDKERQLTGPRSPLHGIPVILKDNYDTFDLPTTAGSVVLEGSIPPDDAFLVKQFRDAGAVILGKANLDEWAHGGSPGGGYSSLGGQTLNPYNLNRGPSGSSGGTGAAIAANFDAIGTGSDTGGSIRGPSAANGVVGIKPTLGLTSRDGIIPFALSLDVGGPLARTVTDGAIALGVMTGVDPNDSRTLESSGKFYKDYTQFLDVDDLSGARIGVARNFFGGNAEVDQAVNGAIEKMEDLGATIVDSTNFPEDVLDSVGDIYSTISDTEFKSQIADYLATLGDDAPAKTLADIIAISESPEVANSEFPVNSRVLERLYEAQARGPLTDPDYLSTLENGTALIENTIVSIMDANNLDAIVYPTSTCPATPLPSVEDPTYVCDSVPSASSLANISGFPDVSVPAGFTEAGLPINISLLGRAYSEPTLLGLAYSYEQATMFRHPPSTTPPLPGEEFEYQPVPEPSENAALTVLSLSALFGLRFRQKRPLKGTR